MRRRTHRLAAALLVVAAVATLVASAAGAKDERAPTIVLVHGAWAGPGSWKEVVKNLRDDHLKTDTPTLAEQTLAGDVATVRAELDAIPGKKVLVAHSYGGMVISGASAGRSDVLGVVYVSAFVPDQGDTILSLGAGYVPPAALPHLIFTGTPWASPAFIDPAFFAQDFAQDVSPKVAAKLNAEQRPINASILGEPSGPVGWHTLPSWFVVTGADRMVDPNLQRAEAAKLGATTIELADASHVGGLTRYADRTAALIESAVRATD
jgi:pimeloyl-ACP methyl ester carboxylesterase